MRGKIVEAIRVTDDMTERVMQVPGVELTELKIDKFLGFELGATQV